MFLSFLGFRDFKQGWLKNQVLSQIWITLVKLYKCVYRGKNNIYSRKLINQSYDIFPKSTPEFMKIAFRESHCLNYTVENMSLNLNFRDCKPKIKSQRQIYTSDSDGGGGGVRIRENFRISLTDGYK